MFFDMFRSDPSLNISPEEVKAKLDRGEKFVLLDVREAWEVAINRLEGAVTMPMAELGQRHTELDPGAEIVVYCHMGVRSLKATRFLKEQQFKNVKNLAGGIDAWSLQVDPKVPRYR
jgi:rhodanese-related sulfurtransferase